jgi:DNA-binding XRE family transcriptional regulator
MGATRRLRRIVAPTVQDPRAKMVAVPRGRPRDFAEWRALRRWGKLPAWEQTVAGYLLRAAREERGLSQRELAGRLGVSQQAVAQAERWRSNPTVELIRRWAAACGAMLEIRIGKPEAG